MKFKHLFSATALLFGLNSICYGYLTGGNFYLKLRLPGLIFFDIVVWTVLIFVSYGTVIYLLNITIDRTHIFKVWLLPGFLSLLPVAKPGDSIPISQGHRGEGRRVERKYVYCPRISGYTRPISSDPVAPIENFGIPKTPAQKKLGALILSRIGWKDTLPFLGG